MNTRRNVKDDVRPDRPRPGFAPVRRRRDARPRRARHGGFSLIELLLVLVILATLTAIVAPKFVGRSEQARVTAAQRQIGDFETALAQFQLDCRRYPTEAEGLRALVEEPADVKNWQEGGYLGRNAIPKDPWDTPYIYVYPGKRNPSGYDVYSAGPNGEEGDADDIGNWIDED